MDLLPTDVKKIIGSYRQENQFLKLFVKEYYLDNANEKDYEPPLQKEFRDLLQLNNLKSKLITRIKNNIYTLRFVMDNSDIIDVNIIKQFILLILPYVFNDILQYDDWDWRNSILDEINFNLRKYEIPLAVVGTFSQHIYNKNEIPIKLFYLFDGKNNIKLDIK